MNSYIKKIGLFSGCAMLALASSAAAETPAAASDSATRIEEVVVTATRRAENLQDVPIAVTALTSQRLEAAGITNTTQIANQTPGLVIHQQVGAMQAHIRGVGSLDATAGQEASVATFIDGVYMPTAYGAIFSLNNVERVEVLKGPQGTLFGRNATGGAIQVITKTPSHTPSADIRASYGNFNTAEGKFYGTTGLGENLAIDLAAYYHHQGDAYGRNVTTGAGNNRTVETAVRSKLLFTPTDSTTVTLSGGGFKADYHGAGAGRQMYPGAIALTGVAMYTGKFYDVTGITANTQVKNLDVNGQILQDLGAFSLKSITAYRKVRVRQNFDNDFTPVPLIDVYTDNQSYKTFTQEVQAISDPSSKVKWIVGGFFMHDKSGFAGPLGLGLFGAAIVPTPPLGVGIRNIITTTSYAGFGETTIPLFGDRTNLTLGARYTSDKRELTGQTDVRSDPVNQVSLAVVPVVPVSKTFSKVTYRAILDHKFSDDVMVYGSYSRGFKAGNFNTVTTTDPAFNPEVLDSFEAGFKSDLLDGILRLNASAYYYTYKDIQLPVTSGPTISTLNAAKAKIKGVEVQGVFAPTEHFSLEFGANLMKATVNKFVNAPCYVGDERGANVSCGVAPVTSSRCVLATDTGTTRQYNCDLSGNRLPDAPKLTFNLTPTYTLVTDAGKFVGSIGYSYTSKFFWEFANTRAQKGYSMVNAQLSWTGPDDHLGVRVYGQNLLDKKYAIYGNTGLNGDSYAAGSPATYGVELSYKF